ncbi:MAG: 30S ribosomal protein S11 [Simkaniaceae bacterium]|nr:30S ribosomal protein S11 [Simkaniaceae bacterium]MCF7851874.1 30S ribosomal protein S11 [Simkaniaceae bacterium]
MAKKPVAKSRKKGARSFPVGIVHVKATFNNTIVSITDLSGNVVAWASAGKSNFSGSRKSSAFAATVAAQDAAKIAMSMGMKEVEINLKGPGAGRESAVRGIQGSGLAITAIRDRTPIPHNGCRPRKRRRV